MLIAQLSQALDDRSPSRIRILPVGKFRAVDGSGRPTNVAAWIMNAEIAKMVIAASFASHKELLIDYDHQSLSVREHGQLVPAAGWFSGLEWQEGGGLYATAIEWNIRAALLIAAKEYRFISPVFSYDATGAVQRVISVALTEPRNQRGMDLLRRMIEGESGL